MIDSVYTRVLLHLPQTQPVFFNWWENPWLRAFFYKQRLFPTQPQCCLTFSWIEPQKLLWYCLIHISIILLRHFLYLLYLCPCLDLGLFMSYLCNLFFIFIFTVIMINHIISWIQTTLVLLLIFENMSYYFWMTKWIKNVNNFKIAKAQPQVVVWHLLDFLPISAWRCLQTLHKK